MILLIDCILGCVLFGTFIVISVLKNQESWINEYPESVQKRYIELHPDFRISEPEGLSTRVLIKKVTACVIFILLLFGMVYISGAKTFIQGCYFCYTIWSVVNAFDVVVLDLGLMVHWKKCRLPGTEDMDDEYKLLTKKSLMDGLFGCLIGIPVSLIVGGIIICVCH